VKEPNGGTTSVKGFSSPRIIFGLYSHSPPFQREEIHLHSALPRALGPEKKPFPRSATSTFPRFDFRTATTLFDIRLLRQPRRYPNHPNHRVYARKNISISTAAEDYFLQRQSFSLSARPVESEIRRPFRASSTLTTSTTVQPNKRETRLSSQPVPS
jgi:hypothetical protein